MASPEDTMILDTTKGRVVIAMRPDLAPGHVARIKELVREGFYDGIVFHRVIDGFMAQTGCPHGTGTGGSGKKLKAEFNKEPHVRGTVSMARARRSQFRRQPVLHLLRRRDLPRQPVHRLGQCGGGHGERRQDQARRAGARSRQDRQGDHGGRRQEVASTINARLACVDVGEAMRTDLFDFDLPAERIALRPAVPRDAARLLVVRPGGALEDRGVRDLPDLLNPGDALVVNDTKRDPGAAHRPAHRPRHRAEDRGDADRAARRLALARLRAAGEEACRRRRRPLRRGGQGLLPRPARRHGGGQGRGRRGDAVVCLPRAGAGPGHRRAGRHAAAALYRVASASPTSRTAPTTRPCSRATRARSRRRPRACISPTS